MREFFLKKLFNNLTEYESGNSTPTYELVWIKYGVSSSDELTDARLVMIVPKDF